MVLSYTCTSTQMPAEEISVCFIPLSASKSYCLFWVKTKSPDNCWWKIVREVFYKAKIHVYVWGCYLQNIFHLLL